MKRQAEISEWLPGGLGPRVSAATAASHGANGTVDLDTVAEIVGFHRLARGVRDILRFSGHV